MFSDSRIPTARVQQYAFLFNQFGWSLKMQFKHWILFSGSFTNYRHLPNSSWGLFLIFCLFSIISFWVLVHWDMTDPSSLPLYFPLLISLRGNTDATLIDGPGPAAASSTVNNDGLMYCTHKPHTLTQCMQHSQPCINFSCQFLLKHNAESRAECREVWMGM